VVQNSLVILEVLVVALIHKRMDRCFESKYLETLSETREVSISEKVQWREE
jgi:hypothetical protein